MTTEPATTTTNEPRSDSRRASRVWLEKHMATLGIDFGLYDAKNRDENPEPNFTDVSVHTNHRNCQVSARHIKAAPDRAGFIVVGVGSTIAVGDSFEIKNASLFLDIDKAEQLLAKLQAAILSAKVEQGVEAALAEQNGQA